MYTVKIGHYSADIYPDDPGFPVIYLHTEHESGEEIHSRMTQCCTLIVIYGTDWNRDFSTQPAAKVFRKGEDFSGGAPQYLKTLTETILPEIETNLPFPVADRGIAGYSLAGLFALYAGYLTPIFNRIASVSGSMWFDGWAEYALVNFPANPTAKIYLSLGDREQIGKNPRMNRVRDCTDAISAHLKEKHAILYEINPGGHFNDGAGRTAKAIETLCGM